LGGVSEAGGAALFTKGRKSLSSYIAVPAAANPAIPRTIVNSDITPPTSARMRPDTILMTIQI